MTNLDSKTDFSTGIAIGSIVKIDKNRTLEPVKYPAGSGFFRLLMAPMITGKNIGVRILKKLASIIKQPIKYLKVVFRDD